MCTSGIQNKWIRVETTGSLISMVLPTSNNNCRHFKRKIKTCFFWMQQNCANSSNLTSANISKTRDMIYLNTLLHNFCTWKGNSNKCIFNKVRRQNNFVHTFSVLILHCVSLVKPDSTILTPKDCLCWRKLLVKLALKNWKLHALL